MKITRVIRNAARDIIVPVFKVQASISRRYASFCHKMLLWAEWGITDAPEQFDHYLDLYYQWGEKHIPHWVERGVFNLLAIKSFKEPTLVELCCGEGFNTQYFYSTSCKNIWACDFDKKAIKEAKKKHRMRNITFVKADIRNKIPERWKGEYPTNIVWEDSIEHFTQEEIALIMQRIKKVLSHKKGILSGMTIQAKGNGEKSHPDHEYEFKNMTDLKRFFAPYFENVVVWETIYEDRHNLYFMASDGVLPFTKQWSHWEKSTSD